MPRPIWGGAISFGLVNVPVRMFAAIASKDVRFHQLHATDHVRIQQRRRGLAMSDDHESDDGAVRRCG